MELPSQWKAVYDTCTEYEDKCRWRLCIWRECGTGARKIVDYGPPRGWSGVECEQAFRLLWGNAGNLLLTTANAAGVSPETLKEADPVRRWLFALPEILQVRWKKVTGWTDSPDCSPDDDLEAAIENVFTASKIAIRQIVPITHADGEVTLINVALLLGCEKKTLQNHLSDDRKAGKDVPAKSRGKKGTEDRYFWSALRPWLLKRYSASQLPESFSHVANCLAGK